MPYTKFDSRNKDTKLISQNAGIEVYHRTRKGSQPFYKLNDYDEIIVTPSNDHIQFYQNGIPVEADTTYQRKTYYPLKTLNPFNFLFMKSFDKGQKEQSSTEKEIYFRNINNPNTKITNKVIMRQQGGQLNMDEQQLQQAFIQWLAQKLGVQSQEELEGAIQQMGEEGLKQAYAQFMQEMQQQQVQAAKFGAKLNYIKSLRGQCPEGYEMQMFKKGGQLCKKCMKKAENGLNTNQVYDNAVDAFKCGRKMKKKACGGNLKKRNN